MSPRINIRRSSWHIRVTPKVGEKGESPDIVITVCHAFVKPFSKYVHRVAELVISILNSKVEPEHHVITESNNEEEMCLDHDDLFAPDAEMPLENDELIVQADIKMLYEEAIPDELPRYKLCSISESSVGRDFVLVSGDGDERHVHKAILNASSPVFKRMFDSNLEECRTGRCVISDISTETLDILSHFMYHSSVKELQNNAETILPAADKYEMLNLKAACEEALADTISKETMADLLFLSDTTAAADLKKAVLKFVKTKAGNGSSKKAIDGLMDNAVKSGRTELVKELFNAVFQFSRRL